jgi:hypothetical protein
MLRIDRDATTGKIQGELRSQEVSSQISRRRAFASLLIPPWKFQAASRLGFETSKFSLYFQVVVSLSIPSFLYIIPGDLGTWKRPGTSCKIEIYFWFKITEYLINDIKFLFQICPRHSFPCVRHRHKVSNSFTKESGRDK